MVSEHMTSRPSLRGSVLAMASQGLLYASWAASVSMFLGPRFGLSIVGLVTGASAVGRVASLSLEKSAFFASHRIRLLLALFSAIAMSLACRSAPWQIVIILTIVGDMLFGLYNSSSFYLSRDHIPLGSAASMFTQALGLTVFGALTSLSDNALSAAIVVASLLCLSSMRLGSQQDSNPVEGHLRKKGAFPLIVSLGISFTSYAPLVIFPTILSLEMFTKMVGPAYFAYALGSLAAAANKRAQRAGLLEAFLLAALGSAVWMLGLVSEPYVLTARFISGILMFSAQSAVLSHFGRKHGRTELAMALVGLLVGAQLSAFWAGPVASVSVSAMSAVSFAGTLLVGFCIQAFALRKK